MTAWLALVLACGTPTEPEASWMTEGQVLFVDGGVVVLQHDTTEGRVTPTTLPYRVTRPEHVAGLVPGERISLNYTDASGTLEMLEHAEIGSSPLPPATNRGGNPIEGTVVRIDPGRLTLDHDRVPGVMGAMVMPFQVRDDEASKLTPGDRVRATLVGSDHGFVVVNLQVTGQGAAELREDIAPLDVGQVFPRTRVPVEDGSELLVGAGQDRPTVLTFLYTTCPDPNFCPALAARLQALQAQIPAGQARIVALTIDPEHDVVPVLKRYAELVAADPDIWRFGRLEPAQLQRAALLSGMSVTVQDGKIVHLLRLLVLDEEGRLVAHYKDNEWDQGDVLTHLGLTD